MSNVRGIVPRRHSTEYDVLQAVVKWWSTKTYGPTIEDIRERVEVRSKSTIQYHIDRLVADGFLLRAPGQSGSLRPSPKGAGLVRLYEEHAEASG